jgi:hypothetical protein
MLSATRIGVQRHWRPYSIKSPGKLAMVVASPVAPIATIAQNLSSAVWPNEYAFIPKGRKQSSSMMMVRQLRDKTDLDKTGEQG